MARSPKFRESARAISGRSSPPSLTARRRRYRALIVGGGVTLNGALREALTKVAADAGVELLLARPKYCGDNAAMIAGLAYYRRNLTGRAAAIVDVHPSLEAGDEASVPHARFCSRTVLRTQSACVQAG